MRLARIRCVGVAGVPTGTWDLTRPDTAEPLDLVLFTGPPASGKTRLLEAIAAAKERLAPPGPIDDDARWIERGSRSAKIELTWWFDGDERAPTAYRTTLVETEVIFGEPPEHDVDLEHLLGTYEHAPRSPKLEYFPAARHIDPRRAIGLDERAHEPLRGRRDPGKYAFVPRFLREAQARGQAQTFARHLAAFPVGLGFDATAAAAGEAAFVAEARGQEVRRDLGDLSAGEADAVIFAATAALIGLDRSVVLIDRPDLHLGGADPARLVAALRGLGQGTQILAASPSEALARSVPHEHLVPIAPRG